MRLTPEQVDASALALALVRALMLNTDSAKNKQNSDAPVVVTEDYYSLDNDVLPYKKAEK